MAHLLYDLGYINDFDLIHLATIVLRPIAKYKIVYADEKDPNIKYFKPASTENEEFFLNEAIT